jgi:exopolyphosphatase/guanosine-5'-triphosphate,3'-diphosphate pyrophosphatase
MTELRAVLDVGSNTVRLLVGRLHDGTVEPLLDRSEFVRLGLGVDATGELRTDRQAAAIEAIRELAQIAYGQRAERIVAIATSAVRDARNGSDFARKVKEETGIDLEIISGEREAELTFRGGTMGIDAAGGVLVCDLGGGSAELIHAGAEGIRWAVSEPLGSGRLSERFLHHDPPEEQELSALRRFVESVLRDLPPARVASVVFTGGTATHVAILAGQRPAHRFQAVSSSGQPASSSGSLGTIQRLSMAELGHVIEIVNSHTAAQIVDMYGIRPERAEVLPAGITAIAVIARFYEAEEIVITQRGIREGALAELT